MKTLLKRTLGIVLAVCMVFALCATSASAVSIGGYINRDGVNFRSGPGTGYAIKGCFDKDTKLTITNELTNGWCAVIINGNSGYVYGSYVSKGTPSDPTALGGGTSPGGMGLNQAAHINANGVNLRAGAGTDAKIIGNYSRNTPCTLMTEEASGWCGVVIGGVRGYVYGAYVTKGAPGSGGSGSGSGSGSGTGMSVAGFINRDGVNFRSTPNGTIRGVFNKDKYVTITGEYSNGWCSVIIDGYYGYVYGQYVSKGTPSSSSTGLNKPAHVNSDNVYMYAGAGWYESVIQAVPKGTSLTLQTEEASGWCRVVVGGVNGFIYGAYITYGP